MIKLSYLPKEPIQMKSTWPQNNLKTYSKCSKTETKGPWAGESWHILLNRSKI